MRLNISMLEGRSKSHRFVVDTGLRAEFVGVVCDWPNFVYLALGLGMDPSTGGLSFLKQAPTRAALPLTPLIDADGTTIMSLSIHDDDWVVSLADVALMLSVRRALAWDLTMVLNYGGIVRFIPLFDDHKPLRKYTSRHVGYHLSNGAQREISLSTAPLRSMLIWILYVEMVSRDPQSPETLPVPMYFFKIREEVLNDLKTLHIEEGALKVT